MLKHVSSVTYFRCFVVDPFFQSFEALLSLFQKPRNKKRPFIDKRNERTTTFALLHRSQKDPLAADSDAPQMVLHQHPDVIKRKEEEREHGVFFEDDYDYLQHLKDRSVFCWSSFRVKFLHFHFSIKGNLGGMTLLQISGS